MLIYQSYLKGLSRHIDRQAARKISEILGQVYEEVAQTVTKKEINKLKEIIGELAQAQERTEKSLNQLIQNHRQTRERLESNLDAVGYNLENQSYKGLPPLLKRDLGIEVDGRLIRRYLPGEKEGQYLQINIYGWDKKNGQKMLILGQAKTSVSRREISRFKKMVKKAAQVENISLNDICQVIVVHNVVPNIEEYVREQGIHLYWSYDLQKVLPKIEPRYLIHKDD